MDENRSNPALTGSTVSSRLKLEELRIPPALLEQLGVGSTLQNTAVFEDEDAIRHPDSREAMRNEDRRRLFGGLLNREKDLRLRFGIKAAVGSSRITSSAFRI